MSNETLTAARVESTFVDCLVGTPDDPGIEVEGVVSRAKFRPEKLEEHRVTIEGMLAELPSRFMAESGGGWSFLAACADRHGEQWTGMHRSMEQLFQLGMGIGVVRCQLPREMWEVLPGGMPYYVVDLERSEA